MTRRFCDRCDKQLEPNQGYGVSVPSESTSNSFRDYDVCVDCLRSLNVWIQTRPQAVAIKGAQE